MNDDYFRDHLVDDDPPEPTLALLPHLTASELEILHRAIQSRILELAKWRDLAKTAIIAEPHINEIRVLMSLDTAVCEAKYSLERVEGGG